MEVDVIDASDKSVKQASGCYQNRLLKGRQQKCQWVDAHVVADTGMNAYSLDLYRAGEYEIWKHCHCHISTSAVPGYFTPYQSGCALGINRESALRLLGWVQYHITTRRSNATHVLLLRTAWSHWSAERTEGAWHWHGGGLWCSNYTR
jgi:hypothetical protein